MKDDGLDRLFQDGGDDLADVVPRQIHKAPPGGDPSRHIGCPLWWFQAVYPIMGSKAELAVALILYRLHAIEGGPTIAVTNGHLMAEMGIDRFTKYRALRKLEEAGLVTVQRRGTRALRVTLLRRRRVYS